MHFRLWQQGSVFWVLDLFLRSTALALLLWSISGQSGFANPGSSPVLAQTPSIPQIPPPQDLLPPSPLLPQSPTPTPPPPLI
ncbi:MAG: hypothetical protein SFW36_15845, partial [Leptolyngbyaceae cyanobacterium bins.59]|nr:hypothetical protein [Leptolyngbyaceae cyanobacterium bins.59]